MGDVDVEEGVDGERIGQQALDELGYKGGGGLEVDAVAGDAVGRYGGGDGGHAQHGALEGGGDGAAVGQIPAEVGAVVDAGDDEVALAFHDDVVTERDAVGGGGR